MKRRLAIQKLLGAGAVSLLQGLRPGFAQTEKEQPLIRSDVRLVLLDVSVKDHGGGLVVGLVEDNFAVFVNRGEGERKALVRISDGGDNASRHGRQEVLDRIQSNIATIYSIGLFTTGEPDQDPGILKRLSKISGGEAWFPATPEGMGAVCR